MWYAFSLCGIQLLSPQKASKILVNTEIWNRIKGIWGGKDLLKKGKQIIQLCLDGIVIVAWEDKMDMGKNVVKKKIWGGTAKIMYYLRGYMKTCYSRSFLIHTHTKKI